MAPKPFPEVRAAAADGRLANVYFKQEQLKGLHDALVKNADAIQQALVKDSSSSTTDATIELCLALDKVKRRYNELQPARELADEYRITNGKNAVDRREGVGIAYIVPSNHSPLFSVVAPAAAALAAGNCVVIELPKTLREIPSIIRSIFEEAFEPPIYAFSDSRPADKEFLQSCVLTLQNEEALDQYYPHLLHSTSQSPVVAVVDRTADLQQAAKALVAARFSFNGTSPYAPDLVLVNEFIKRPFLNAVAQESIRYMTELNGHAANGSATNGVPVRSGEKAAKSLLEEARSDSGVRVVTSGASGAILDVENRKSSFVHRKVNERVLLIHAVTSVDDAIDFINGSTNSTLLASYLFGSPAAGKYLSQFIRGNVAFINHVPTELLIGPAAPSSYPVNPSDRYPANFFSVSRPQYIVPSPQESILSQVVLGDNLKKLQAIKTVALSNLKVEKRAETYGIGYFEQGILSGLAVWGVPILAALTTGLVYGAKLGWRAWAVRR